MGRNDLACGQVPLYASLVNFRATAQLLGACPHGHVLSGYYGYGFRHGRGLLWGGALPHPEVFGYSPVHFAKHMLEARGDSLVGKRCLITGSGKVALAVADRLVALGAIPLTFSDQSGHIYEPEGIADSKLRQISTIKAERGARIGRYIIASTTAKYNDPESIYDIPCDVVFPTSSAHEIDEANALKVGDLARIVECAPKSKLKRWEVLSTASAS